MPILSAGDELVHIVAGSWASSARAQTPIDPALNCAAGSTQFPPEICAGLFAKHGLKGGDRVEGPTSRG